MLRNLIEYLINPPAIKALGKSVYGFAGRVGTKRHKAALKKALKSMTQPKPVSRGRIQ